MDKEHAKGVMDKAAGKTKEAVGRSVGNKKLDTSGLLR